MWTSEDEKGGGGGGVGRLLVAFKHNLIGAAIEIFQSTRVSTLKEKKKASLYLGSKPL